MDVKSVLIELYLSFCRFAKDHYRTNGCRYVISPLTLEDDTMSFVFTLPMQEGVAVDYVVKFELMPNGRAWISDLACCARAQSRETIKVNNVDLKVRFHYAGTGESRGWDELKTELHSLLRKAQSECSSSVNQFQLA